MKAVILAGGLGSRLSEETNLKPKPMVEIGGKPIILHIMEIYAAHGVTDFVICAGYKSNVIKDFFINFAAHVSDVEVNLKQKSVKYLSGGGLDWTIKIIDTGAETLTGGRLKRIKQYVAKEDCFHMTYGDGVADIDITALTKFHKDHGKLATVSTVAPVGRFGAIKVSDDSNIVSDFSEKPAGDNALINGGYFVLNPAVLDLIADDTTIWERDPMERLVEMQELVARPHRGFWHPMDTLRDKNHLNSLVETKEAPWINNV